MTKLAEDLGSRIAALVKALEPGQRDGGQFIFQVRVNGIGARPVSPQRIARELCLFWQGASQEQYGSEFTVTVEEPFVLKELEAMMAPRGPAE